MTIPHVLVIPYPILGMVNPFLQFALVLAKQGCKITFVNTEFNHNRTKTTSAEQDKFIGSQIKMVTIPDGLSPQDDRTDQIKVLLSVKSSMPSQLHKLIQHVNAVDLDNKINCIVVSINMGWALEVGSKLGIKGAVLFSSSATSMALCDSIQRLIDEGTIESEKGLPIKKQVQLSPNMPTMDTDNLPWCNLGKNSKIYFDHLVKELQVLKLGEWWLCNTSYDLESGVFSHSQKLLPIGPIVASDNNTSSFWQEDTTCLKWLNQQPPQSVIYVSFGSLAVVEANQFKELALGLDLLNMPFLWVVRPGNENEENHAYPDEFQGKRGKLVGWAPQKKILNHPAIACFISHCGWNSTLEGACSGVPFLCWPFFSDQLLNQWYICDVWKIGLGFDKDENGVISSRELKNKVEQLLGNEDIKARSLKLKEMVINNVQEGGHSTENLRDFINWVKE